MVGTRRIAERPVGLESSDSSALDPTDLSFFTVKVIRLTSLAVHRKRLYQCKDAGYQGFEVFAGVCR